MAATERAASNRSEERDAGTTRRRALLAGATVMAAPGAAGIAAAMAPATEAKDGPAGQRGEGPPVAAIAPVTVLRLEEKLRQRVVLQDHVLATIANAIRRWWSGLADPRRPIGSFLFLGPTGVGKTALAQAVAEHLFGSEEAMVRLDMGDYADAGSAGRLPGGGAHRGG